MQRLWKRSGELVDAAFVRIRSCKFIECCASHSLPFLFKIYNWRNLYNEFRWIHKVGQLYKKKQSLIFYRFCKDFAIFPEILSKAKLMQFFHTLSQIYKKSKQVLVNKDITR